MHVKKLGEAQQCSMIHDSYIKSYLMALSSSADASEYDKVISEAAEYLQKRFM
jgi:hypothetical protein